MEEQDNIEFHQVTSLDWGTTGVKEEQKIEKEYDSLYDELLDKCNPSEFKGTQKFYIANDIFSELLNKSKNILDEEIIKLRDKAIDELDVHISTAKKFACLSKILDPDNYMNLKPYNKELVANAGRIYDSIIQNKDDIRELERIEGEESTKSIIEEYDYLNLAQDEYIEKYPKGKYANEIREIKFKQIQKDKSDEYLYFMNCSAEEYVEKYPQGTYFEEAKKFIEDYRSYLEKYPNGRYKEEAEDAKKERTESIIVFVAVLCIVFIMIIIGLISNS